MHRGRRPVHRPWTDKNRIVLCLLKRSYERKYIATIWSYVFRTRLTIEGFQHGIPSTTLDAQYQEMKGGGGGHKIYEHIIDATEDLLKREYKVYLEGIRQAIGSLGLGISFRTSKLAKVERNSNTRRQAIRRRAASIPDTIISNETPPPAGDTTMRERLNQYAYHASPYFVAPKDIPATATPAAQASIEFETPMPPLLRISTDNDGNATQSHPLLLFRATPIINQFVSRKFVDKHSTIPPPPLFSSSDFKDIAWPHLQRDRSYSSPFISFAQNPRNAVRRVELARSEDVDRKMFLVIFAFNDLRADAREQFGEDSGPYLVRSLFTAKEISDLPDGYKGAGEWLMYGAINCEPVALLDSAQAIKLAKALRRFRVGDASAVLEVGESLQGVPMQWKEVIAYNFLRYYCGKNQLPETGSQPYKVLMQTILQPSQDSLAGLVSLCKGSATGDIEHSPTEEPFGGTEEEEEEEEEPETEEATDESLSALPILTQVLVRVPTRAEIASHNAVNKLNILAAKASTQSAEVSRHRPTPLWSPDTESAIYSPVPVGRFSQHESVAEREPSLELNNANEEWDMVDDDLQMSFAEEFPSAARKLRQSTLFNTDAQRIIPSIEQDHEIDTFTSELLRSAYGPSPSSTPSRGILRDLDQQPSKPGHASPALSTTSSRMSSFVDLTEDMANDPSITTSTKTPPKPTPTLGKRQAMKDDDLPNEDDFVITGSGRRQRVWLPLRSLSVQEAEEIEDDDDYMSALEIL